MLTAEELSEIKKFNRNVEWLKKKEIKTDWVQATAIRKLTGWSVSYMERARHNGYVRFKKNGNRYLYDPSSIPAIFLKSNINYCRL